MFTKFGVFTLEIASIEGGAFGYTKFGIIKLEIAFSSAQAPEFFGLGAHFPGPRLMQKLV